MKHVSNTEFDAMKKNHGEPCMLHKCSCEQWVVFIIKYTPFGDLKTSMCKNVSLCYEDYIKGGSFTTFTPVICPPMQKVHSGKPWFERDLRWI